MKRVTTMTKKTFTNADLFNFSTLEKQIAKIKKEKNGATKDIDETSVNSNTDDLALNSEIRKLLENQLSVLQDIQYKLGELESLHKKKKRSFLFSKNERES